MIPRLRARAPGTRATRFDPRERRLESLAGEFALLSQRRTRTMHELALLDQQRAAAAAKFFAIQSRLAWLLERMDAIDPALRDAHAYDALPEPPPPPPPPPAPEPPPRAAPARARKLPGAAWAALRPGARPLPAPGK